MFRDRTNLFISYRQSYTHHPYFTEAPAAEFNDENPLVGDGEAIEMEILPPAYLELTRQLDQALDSLRAKMAQLAPLHRQNALPGFDDRSGVERDIEVITLQITKGLHRCQALVKQFGELSGREVDISARNVSTNIKVSMAAKLQEASATFRKMQSSYLQALQRDQTLDAPGLLGSNSGNALEDDEDDVAYSHMALQQQQHRAELDDTEVSQREREIERIARGVLEVAEIFKDMQSMVIDQGTLIDRIDYNVENVSHQVQDADQELLKGARYQKRTTKCKVILLLVLVIVGLILILIFKPRHRTVYEDIRPIPHDPQPPSQPSQPNPPTDGSEN